MFDPKNPRTDTEELDPQPPDSEALTPLQEARRRLRQTERKLSRQIEENKQAKRRLARQREEIVALQTRLAKMEAGDTEEGIRPENIVWIFGSGRTGSSWLAFMMGALPEHSRWNEPLVGYLFGHTITTGP